MTEWGVVLVIIALVGLVVSIATPMVKLNGSITRLTVSLDKLIKDSDEQRRHSRDTHQRLWNKAEEQDRALCDHEARITTLERK